MVESCGTDGCLALQRLTVKVDDVEMKLSHRDAEQGLTISSITTRIDNMEDKYDELRSDVKKEIQSIKDDIPEMFANAINDLMAKIFKTVLKVIATLIGFIILVCVLAFSRPYLVSALDEIKQKVEQAEVPK